MKRTIIVTLSMIFVSCSDFLDRYPLDAPTSDTFWTSVENARLWINNLYRGLPTYEDFYFESMSDNAYTNVGTEYGNVNQVSSGSFQSNTGTIGNYWNYSYIRQCLEFLEKVEQIPNITQKEIDEMSAEAKFILAFKYYQLITLFRDVPLVKKTMAISESDIPKSSKNDVLDYILENLDFAIDNLKDVWSANETGRATKGAALALKSRVLLYNEQWADAASAAKQIIDSKSYQLHPKFGEVFLKSFNNKTKEVILARQYAKDVAVHGLNINYSHQLIGGYGSAMPLPSLVNDFECSDGFPIGESDLYDETDPFKNRDPRFYETFIYPYQTFAGVLYDPFKEGSSIQDQAKTYMYYRKYLNDMQNGETSTYVNWIIFRFADVLLMYTEAKNEESGPDNSVYEALDSIRVRAGMPRVDRTRYSNKETLRELIRNERRVELAAEGLRYFDIIRWRIAETTQNIELRSMEVPGMLPVKIIGKRVFDKTKHYVWPIPQSAIDDAKNLKQHDEWK